MRKSVLALATAALALAAAQPAPGVPSEQRAAPTHRIGVRVVGGDGEFYDRLTGRRFVPRGANYLRRGWQETPYSGRVFHSATFVVGRYDGARAEAALRAMRGHGYNVVRVFVDGVCERGCVADPATRAISREYVANVADFLRRAKRNGLHVLLTIDSMPPASRWHDLLDAYCCGTFGHFNLWYLTPAGAESFAGFWQALIDELLRQRAPTDAIWAYSLDNESHYQGDHPPFTLASGSVATANGRTYDLASEADRRRMMDENLVHWIDAVRRAIRAADPTALVTIGFFPPPAAGPLLTRAAPAFASTVDFVDLHAYPLGRPLPEVVRSFELPQPSTKPVVMGELGAFRFAHPTPAAAAKALVAWQRASCRFGFDGWLTWTWDTTLGPPGEQPLWTAVAGGGAIARALAPRTRPEPCRA